MTTALANTLISTTVLAYATKVRKDSKWDYSLQFRVTRCFNMKNVKVRCDSDTINGVVNAELEITAVDAYGKRFSYGYGKSIEGNLCNEHLRKIRSLIKKQQQVCVAGDGETPLDDGETYSHWRELETRNGKVIW